LGKINSDAKVANSIKQRALFSALYPSSIATKDIEQIAAKIAAKLERNVLVTSNESGLSGLFRRLMEHF
jgi:flagellar biosynthesis protein FlhG